MHYNKIRKMDISNGPGVRVSIFVQGCTFHCKNCFNPETHDFNGGKEFDDDTIKKVLDLCQNDSSRGLSILGGEPLHPKNIEEVTRLAKTFKETYPNKDIWVWTGFHFEDLKEKEIFHYIDVLVDGQFDEELKDPRLKWRGSSNQRVIDIKRSLKTKRVEPYREEVLV